MDKKKANNQLCAIVRPCGGVIEFIDTNRTAGDVFDSPSEDIRASCSFVVFDPELAVAKHSNANEGDDFGMECILEMAPAHCLSCPLLSRQLLDSQNTVFHTSWATVRHYYHDVVLGCRKTQYNRIFRYELQP